MIHQLLPVIPLSLVGALFFKRKSLAYGFPLFLTLVKMLLTTQPSPILFFTALSLLTGVFIARRLKEIWGGSLWALAGYAVLSVLVYEILSGFGVWMIGGCVSNNPPLYPHTAAGLLHCYRATLPYAAYQFLRDIPLTLVLVEGLTWLGKLRLLEKIGVVKIGVER